MRFSTPAQAAPVWLMPGKPRATIAVTLTMKPPVGGIIARVATSRVSEEGAVEVVADDGLPAHGAWPRRGRELAAGVVDEHVDAAVGVEDARHER
ncbi:MAG: hypothetical protein R3F14_11590 [Polyangiaceae bacterium]